MRRDILFARGISLLMGLTVMLSATSCGTIIYPERRGQSAGNIDVGVAVLDGIGLLFFLVPGIIAFAVDFTTGAIYIPSGFSKVDIQPSDLQDAKIVQAKSGLTRHDIEAVVAKETGMKIDLKSSITKVARVSSDDDLAWVGMTEVFTPDQFAVFENNRLMTMADRAP
ncbi:MAG: hypothetical protein PF692_02500 [Kiritimatiellae bacterium]|jgi:hypothetical protein|nr:hypothetical protein [Kiritimatiellia bacterium]